MNKLTIGIGIALAGALLTGCSSLPQTHEEWVAKSAKIEKPLKLKRELDNSYNQQRNNYYDRQSKSDSTLNLCWFGKISDCFDGAVQYEDGETINFKGNDMVIFSENYTTKGKDDRPIHGFSSWRMIADWSPNYPDHAVVYIDQSATGTAAEIVQTATLKDGKVIVTGYKGFPIADIFDGKKSILLNGTSTRYTNGQATKVILVVKKGQHFIIGSSEVEYVGGLSFKVVKKFVGIPSSFEGVRPSFEKKEDDIRYRELIENSRSMTYNFENLTAHRACSDCGRILAKMVKPNEVKNVSYDNIIKDVLDSQAKAQKN